MSFIAFKETANFAFCRRLPYRNRTENHDSVTLALDDLGDPVRNFDLSRGLNEQGVALANDEGVSAFSQGKTRLMTPVFHQATLRRSTAIASRKIPEYYQGLPFLPITRHDGFKTNIAFHIFQGGDELFRGFTSHGCMHLRKQNLLELFSILMNGKESQLPVEVDYHLESPEGHPYPKRTDAFNYVINCAKPGEAPRSCQDPNHPELTYMTFNVSRFPPVTSLALIDESNERFEFRRPGRSSAR